MEAAFPEDLETPEQREGTAGHFYPTEHLQGRAWPVGTLAPNGHPIDADMIEHGQLLIDDVHGAFKELSGDQYLFRVETKVFAHVYVHPENEGTPDVFLADHVAKWLVVWDYKYGHRYVDPFRNLQLVDYVAGIFEGLHVSPEEMASWRISLRVVQPRNYHRDGAVRKWDTTGAQVWPLIEGLSRAAWAAKSPNAPTLTGAHCRDCRASHACDALMRVSHLAMDIAGESTPHEIPLRAVGVELRRIETAMKRLEARRDGLQAQALGAIAQGQNVPFWTKGFVDSRERWAVPIAEVHTLGDLMGVNLRKVDALTPAQARKAGIDPAVIQAYADKPRGAAKLIPSDEAAAQKAFG